MFINIILILLSILLLFAAYKNFKLKDLIIIPGIMDKVITGSLIGALVLFFLVAYMINANVFGYLFAICTWILFYTLMTCTGFTKEHLIYYGGINIFLSKKKISELKYLKVDYTYASGIVRTLVRGNLLKRTIYFQKNYLKTIEKILKRNNVDFYEKNESVKESN